MSINKLWILIALVVLISGCTTTRYVCSDGSIVDFASMCLTEESDETIQPEIICSYNAYDCADFDTWAEAQAVLYHCGISDIHHLDGDHDGIACESLYHKSEIESEPKKTEFNYSCKDIDKSITQEQKDYGTEDQPLKVTLTKVCSADDNDTRKIRVYWKVENEGTEKIYIYPESNTFVIADSKQYESSYNIFERPDDDLDFAGDLRPGLIVEGGVNVDDVPISAEDLTIILEILYYEDFIFKNIET